MSLKVQHDTLSMEYQYVRLVEEVELSTKESIRIVICMSPIMSHYLMNAKRLTIDTSFKRVQQCEEFEMETWLDNVKRCADFSTFDPLSLALIFNCCSGCCVPCIYNVAIC